MVDLRGTESAKASRSRSSPVTSAYTTGIGAEGINENETTEGRNAEAACIHVPLISQSQINILDLAKKTDK